MLEILKILHFSALLAGGAATIAPGLLMRSIAKTGFSGAPPIHDAMTMRSLGLLGFGAIILLWLTGILMLMTGHSGGSLGLWFALKLLAAALVFGGSAWLNLAMAKAAKTGTPPDPALRAKVIMLSRGALAVALICAVLAFN